MERISRNYSCEMIAMTSMPIFKLKFTNHHIKTIKWFSFVLLHFIWYQCMGVLCLRRISYFMHIFSHITNSKPTYYGYFTSDVSKSFHTMILNSQSGERWGNSINRQINRRASVILLYAKRKSECQAIERRKQIPNIHGISFYFSYINDLHR